MPSSMSPSEAKHQIVWSKTLCPGGASGSRAGALCTWLPLPCPPHCPRPDPRDQWWSRPPSVSALRVARRAAAVGPERLEVVEGEVIPGQEQLDVERQAGMPQRQHEAIPAQPLRIARVMAKNPLPEQRRGRSQTHGGSRMTIANLLDGIHGQDSDCVDHASIEVGPLQRCGRSCGGHALPALPWVGRTFSSLTIGLGGRRWAGQEPWG